MLLSSKEMFVDKVPIDMMTLSEHERRIYARRKYYWANKDRILENARKDYKTKQENLAKAGLLPKRGRPRKYPVDKIDAVSA
jgi:hypothetical protein